MQTVGIVVKQKVPEAATLAKKAEKFLTDKGLNCILDKPSKNMIQKSDMILVLGGDGTFISAARTMTEKSIPILGINMGQLGFLTELKKEELLDGLGDAIDGKLSVSERTMLECSFSRKKKNLFKTPTLNDVVISNNEIARICEMDVYVDGNLLSNIKADGLIVATPTGSTAYSLAAGGPILEPKVPAIVITPICAHSLTLRPIVIRETSEVKVVPKGENDKMLITLDGQSSSSVETGDEITIAKFKKHPLKILHSPERGWFSILRDKLKYGFRN